VGSVIVPSGPGPAVVTAGALPTTVRP